MKEKTQIFKKYGKKIIATTQILESLTHNTFHRI